MNLGNSLFHARKKRGLSQEDVAEKPAAIQPVGLITRKLLPAFIS